jgi:hypothetical protein
MVCESSTGVFEMPILMKQTPIGRRAEFITMADGNALVEQGKARLCVGYEIFDEITSNEIEQGYMTRNMEPITATRKRGARLSKIIEVEQEQPKEND